jgi:glycine oxidase
MQADVVIVGGGVMGCAVAWRLARRGVGRIVVLERAIPGAEASSAAAGILGAQAESAEASPLLDLMLRSRAAWPGFAAELRETSGVDVGYWACGAISVAFSSEEAERLARSAAWQAERGLSAERLDASALTELEPAISPRALAGLLLPDDAQVEPRALSKALALAAAKAGVTFRTGYVRRVVAEGGRARGVELDSELVSAGAVVLAAGSWSALVEGAALPPRAVRPVRGQMVELETRPAPLRHVVFSGHGYVVPRRDGRVLAGSTMEQVGFEKQVTAGGLAQILGLAMDLVPSLAEAPVSAYWSNFRPWTEDGLPLLGPSPLAGLFLATGHFRNGILLVPATADAVAACVAEGKAPPSLAPFSPARLQ